MAKKNKSKLQKQTNNRRGMQSVSNDSSESDTQEMQSSSYYKDLINNHSTSHK